MSEHLIIKNKKAYFNYEIIQTYQAGIVLNGPEIKSIRNHDVSINEAFVLIRKKEIYILNMNVKKYQFANYIKGLEETRTRKLLLHKKEIIKILNKIKQENLTIIPVKLYFKNDYVKLEIALAKGKKLHDKRQTIKKRDTERKELRDYK
ncbi:SsrA-binding protein SmpB [Mycoplasma capricolum subsp. capripneumoniae]|uniref:SsrA-binding protein n=1 Tax=Mycoplasma capricolum subsp. capripneumoniae 87001 TaxID=1124992 RepID=A0A9N7B5D5_MYCCC|nr:SsrA-binding protein SmpB [Mycoplasma capricolum]AJK51118.1 single-stranded DNA-binding protein [Mycoplasma capricolum subsp. capripneumoniae 87001]AOQ21859.1 SsrA-binding protein [Mycoplasma capricolum subsp. capripneumoniae M1601]KEY84373.1 SsrA-binding protein [Mycoplasma capricolum subsp. capripneumoniae 99108]QDL19349.1 SsrA-binding protein [Mycoplasma capricolum subsp. capripneumoniae]QDL20035.1 SsrA-binding protein [Mycoplasma capricolum subsp. capripneumoniae]